MMTATVETHTGETMGRTGDDIMAGSLPEGYSIRAECGILVLRYENIVMFAVFDPTAVEVDAAAISREAHVARELTELSLTEATIHHSEARRLLSQELHEYRYGPRAKAEAIARRRLAKRDAYYGALEAAARTKG